MSDIFIISSSGGGGHLVAAQAIRDKKLQKDPTNSILELDVMRSSCSFGKWIGKKCTDLWDNAQERGDVKKQRTLCLLQPVAEAFFFTGTFFTVLYRLLKLKALPKKLISTQPLHLLAITLAVRVANRFRRDKQRTLSRIDLYLTDLPTEKAQHFFGSLRRLHFLSQKSFAMIRIHSPDPITNATQTSDASRASNEFWKKQAYLEPHQIKKEPLPISLEYKDPHLLPLPAASAKIDIQLFTDAEKLKMSALYLTSSTTTNAVASFAINPEDKVSLIMLGSVPEKTAILQYLDAIIETSRTSPCNNSLNGTSSTFYYFIACGKKEQNSLSDRELKKDGVYAAVCEKIAAAGLPSRIKIVPFMGQPLAPIFARSDISITRSGGMTSAQIIALKSRVGDNKKILLHSPLKQLPQGMSSSDQIRETLLESIPLWENGNANYLAHDKKIAAEVTTPSLVNKHLSIMLSGQ